MKRIYVVTVMMTVGLMLTSCGNTDAQQNSQAVVSDTESQQASDETVANAEQIESDAETGDEEQVPNAEKDAQDNVSDEAASDEVEPKNADENYQFKLSDFKYNIPNDYDVRFVFGETYGNSIKPNEEEPIPRYIPCNQVNLVKSRHSAVRHNYLQTRNKMIL